MENDGPTPISLPKNNLTGINHYIITEFNPTILLIQPPKTMFIIVFTRIIISATIIYIIFMKIGGVLKHLKKLGPPSRAVPIYMYNYVYLMLLY